MSDFCLEDDDALIGEQLTDFSSIRYRTATEITFNERRSRKLEVAAIAHASTCLTSLTFNHRMIVSFSPCINHESKVWLQCLTQLRTLDLGHNRVNDEGFSQLCELGPPTLKKVELHDNKITALTPINTNTTLTYLNVNDNPLCDEGMIGLESNETLRALRIKHKSSRLTIDGYTHVFANECIQSLDLAVSLQEEEVTAFIRNESITSLYPPMQNDSLGKLMIEAVLSNRNQQRSERRSFSMIVYLLALLLAE